MDDTKPNEDNVIFDINIDYKQDPKKIAPGDIMLSDPELTENYINFALNSAYPNGVKGQLRRAMGRLQRKLEIGVQEKAYKVSLTREEVDILQKSFKEAVFKPALSKFVVLLEDEIEKL